MLFNRKLVNKFFCIMNINRVLRHMKLWWTMINPQQWQYCKIITTVIFILVINFLLSFPNSIILCSHVLIVLMTYCMTLIGKDLANNCLICACYKSDYLILKSFVLLTIEESYLHSSSYLYPCSLSKFLTNSSLLGRES